MRVASKLCFDVLVSPVSFGESRGVCVVRCTRQMQCGGGARFFLLVLVRTSMTG